MMEKQNVGIDSAKDKFDACFMYRKGDNPKVKGTRKFPNTEKGRNDFLAWAVKKSKQGVELRFTIEATGVYHEDLAYFLRNQGHHISVVLPNTSKAFGKSLNTKSKNDVVDAKNLALMGLERDLPAFDPGTPQLRELKKIMRFRQGLLKEKTMVSNRLHAENHSFEPNVQIVASLETTVASLEVKALEAEKWAKEIVDNDEELKRRVDNIVKVRGLGFKTVITVIAEMNGFHLFKNRGQVTSFAGYDVIENQSGESAGQERISKKGNGNVRASLYFSAISAAKWEPKFKALFNRVHGRTNIKMKGYVAVQRKLLLLIYTLYTKDLVYDPNMGFDREQAEKQEKIEKALRELLEKGVGSTSLPTLDDIVTNISLLTTKI